MRLSEAISIMSERIKHSDLSEEYLKDNGSFIRKDVFGSEMSYGISMVPSSYAIQIAIYLYNYIGDIDIPLDCE